MSNQDRLNEIGISTPQMAQAQAINHFSNPGGKASRTLSQIKAADLQKFNLIYILGKSLDYQWLTDLADTELELRRSMKRKGKYGCDDLVEVSRPAPTQQQQGALASFKDSIKSFFQA